MQWKWGEHHRYHILCNGNGGEHHRYHILCNGNGVNVIDIIFYVTERMGEHHRYHILCNGKRGEHGIDIMFYVMEMG